MDQEQSTREELAALACHLKSRREAILLRWHAAVQGDAEVTAPQLLSCTQFRDHIPQILDAYERSLAAGPGEAVPEVTRHERKGADHGMHRWQQGYNLFEVLREWGHLHVCLMEELEDYAADRPDADRRAMAAARRALTRLCCGSVTRSAAQFSRLRQAEAAAQVRDLEQALAANRELEGRQAELLRGAAYDLSGNLSIVASASAALGLEDVPAPTRVELAKMVQRSLATQKALLTDLLDLSRLKAGQEVRHVMAFDAAALLRDFGLGTSSFAHDHGVTVQVSGPSPFPVAGDPLKVRRIAQNLLLGALHGWSGGSVHMSWGESGIDDPKHWALCVQCGRPASSEGPAGPLVSALAEPSGGLGAAPLVPATQDRPPTPATESSLSHPGMGIGLTIVKRLCELLDATLELENEHEAGARYRVLFPRSYTTS